MSTYTLVTKPMRTADVPPATFLAAFWERDDGVHFAASMLSDPTSTQPVSFSTSSPVTLAPRENEPVAASSTDQILGATGAVGDVLDYMLVVPATTSPGAITIKDGTGSPVTVFAGGANSVGSLVPFPIPWGKACTGAGWKVTTGANVSVVPFGDFT